MLFVGSVDRACDSISGLWVQAPHVTLLNVNEKTGKKFYGHNVNFFAPKLLSIKKIILIWKYTEKQVMRSTQCFSK